MRIVSIGHAVFAATLIVLGMMEFASGEFTMGWAPVPKGVPAREGLVYLSASISVAAGAGLFWRRTAATSARVLLATLLLWFLAFRVPPFSHGITVDVYWSACAAAVLVSAAWVLSCWFATGRLGLRIAHVVYGAAMIPLGWAHFAYLQHTAELVPGWLPAHVAWAYFTGGAFIAAGIAAIIGVYARLAVTLSALQMGLFLLLVWIPVVAAGHVGAFQWNETVTTWVLTAAAWVVADSYRGRPWLA